MWWCCYILWKGPEPGSRGRYLMAIMDKHSWALLHIFQLPNGPETIIIELWH